MSQTFPYSIFAKPDCVVPVSPSKSLMQQSQWWSLPPQDEKLLEELQAMCEQDKRNECDRSPFLEHNEDRVREIGRRLHESGGTALMERVALRIPEAGDRRELEYCWDGIGEWRA